MNAEFLCFKKSGKWYTSDRGLVTEALYQVFETSERRAQILADNDGLFPGLSTRGGDFTWVVIPDEDAPGYPLMLKPTD